MLAFPKYSFLLLSKMSITARHREGGLLASLSSLPLRGGSRGPGEQLQPGGRVFPILALAAVFQRHIPQHFSLSQHRQGSVAQLHTIYHCHYPVTIYCPITLIILLSLSNYHYPIITIIFLSRSTNTFLLSLSTITSPLSL